MGSVCNGVVVFHRSMVELEERGGVFLHWYLCILLSCETSFSVVVFQRFIVDWRRGMGSVCTGM